MERQLGGLATLLSLEEWRNTDAVKNNRVFLIDGDRNLQAMDLNVASDIEILAEILYPQYLTFGGNGESWVQFEL
jgi:iron complex transport system substrate-binding protein